MKKRAAGIETTAGLDIDRADSTDDLCNIGFQRSGAHRLLARLGFRFQGRTRAKLYSKIALYRERGVSLPEALTVIYANHTHDGLALFAKTWPLALLIPDWLLRHTEQGEP